jgi:hypothetical protein
VADASVSRTSSRRLARKAQALGRKVLNELETLVTPDTLLRWYRERIASKWNYRHRRGPGRPRVMMTILTATDFLSVEVCTIKGLVTYYVLFFIDIASRSVHIGGITPHHLAGTSGQRW